MSFRTIQILERVQWFSLHAAIAALIVGACVAVLAMTAATGIDLIGWN